MADEADAPRPPRLSGIVTMLVVLLLVFLGGSLLLNRMTTTARLSLDYDSFVTQVRHGNVAAVTAKGQSLTGTFRTPVADPADPGTRRSAFSTQRPDFAKDNLLALLRREDVPLSVESTTSQTSARESFIATILPLLLIGGVFWYVMRRTMVRGAGATTFGKAPARRYQPSGERTTFDDVAGIDEARAELEEIADFLRNPERYRRLGAATPRGVLLYGPPGTGKTLLARAVAGEADVPFLSLSASEFVEMYVGVGASRVRDLFAQAKAAAPAIVFIDELDAIGRARSAGAIHTGNDEREQTLNQILAELDGFTGSEGVIVLAATNRPEILDPALLRAGRFDRRVSVNPPDRVGREAILRVHARGHPLDPDVDLGALAAMTIGMVGADLRNLVNEAALMASRRDAEAMCQRDLTDALDKLMLGAARRLVITRPERERTALHEAGHALLGMILPGADPVRKISIVPHGEALGVTLQAPEVDRYGYSADELRGRIVVALGGRAAEELCFGQFTTGAESDLANASRLARQMVERWGMSEAVGPVAILAATPQTVLSAEAGSVSERTRELVDEEVRRIVDDSYEAALVTLRERRGQLDSLAEALLEEETLDEAAAYRAAGIARTATPAPVTGVVEG
jgi:cell division protease FtsH